LGFVRALCCNTPMTDAIYRSLAGGVAYGLVVAAISHPFDTLKCQQQVGKRHAGLAQPQRLSAVAGLYRGVGPATAATVVLRTVPFIGYETVGAALRERHILDGSPLVVAFVAGMAGGVMRGCLETPSELVKTRLQLGEPWRSAQLLRGLQSTCLRTGCVIGTYWALFEATRAWRAALPPLLSDFAAGGLCSVAAWALFYPLDTIKSLIQADGMRHLGMVEALRLILRRSGVGGLYSGLRPGLLRAFLANGGGMAAYGLVQSCLG